MISLLSSHWEAGLSAMLCILPRFDQKKTEPAMIVPQKTSENHYFLYMV